MLKRRLDIEVPKKRVVMGKTKRRKTDRECLREILNTLKRLEDRIDNLATDRWGGAGPDCIYGSGGARHNDIKFYYS